MAGADVWIIAIAAPAILLVLQAIVTYFTNKAAVAAKAEEKRAEDESKRKDREIQYAREDLVAERLMAATAAQAKELTEIKTVSVATHDLANSAYSAQLRTTLAALIGQLTLMREIIDMKNGKGASPATMKTIADTEQRIADLETEIKERDDQANALRRQTETKVTIKDLVVQSDEVTVVKPVVAKIVKSEQSI